MSTRFPFPQIRTLPFAALLSLPLAAAPLVRADNASPADTVATPARPSVQRLIAEGDSAVRRRGGSHAEHAQLFLTWNAPWGHKRAQRSRQPACTDSTVEDTLFLAFTPGRSAARFAGFTGQLTFRATADTLGAWWHMEGMGGENAGALRVEWAGAEGFGWPQPFPVLGQGLVMLTRTPTAAELKFVYAVPAEAAAAVDSAGVYALARIILKHRPERRLVGCGQPVCVEWTTATLAFGPKDEPLVSRGERFVGYGGGSGLCEPFRGPRVAPWRPKP